MPAEIATAFANLIANGLRRKSIVSCSSWAEKCRLMGKPFPGKFSFKYFPWTKKLHDCEAEKWVGMKSAQVGFTDTALNIVFYTVDIKKVDCLYLLPTKSNASEFSAGRFDPALEISPYLYDLFSDVKNVGHKRAGSTNLYVRGTRSKQDLKSIPSGLIVFDELDEMVQKYLSLAEQRQAGQTEPRQIKISTPTTAGRGIDLEYSDSTQEHFFFKCPGCSRYTELIYPECLVLTAENYPNPKLADSYLQCKECKVKLPHQTKCEWLANNEWVPQVFDAPFPGFHINGLYSSAKLREPGKIAEQVIKAREDETIEQELFNSILGKVHEVKGARVTDGEIDSCLKPYDLKPMINLSTTPIITLGVDQGKYLHYEVDMWLPIGEPVNTIDVNNCFVPKLVDEGWVHEFEDLDLLMKRWLVKGCVIDGQPDKRSALSFARRFPGFVYLCFYAEGMKAREVTMWPGEPTISVDRTSWLDMALGRFRHGKIHLPRNLDDEYKKHIKAQVRKPERDRNGNPIARYVTGERVADHLGHARNYSEISLQFAYSGINNQTLAKSPR